ncbi:MAG: hypoxanthine phosphoribosyltransferase [Deltaproteobacteria bacterium]|nr:hypoxanthine phosphoribosyltransferase [Deltaproteobacteria bacterium]MBW1919670.1 hypoxanthine phosphoribosyltransferase [Deltaproteobacteria bacterium]MBW1936208.1 hypoxanthine phosphoribosyltransferase [Deltaproteobacteria bacterium]MBW1978048.1 hypoxanthine phosphoribosyltransferase [Deltaproteobacteria bacterium]MBW2045308.1 hypoxanthine phosphoribosyltransferase [Deltaproteobacteria bacterium]
MATEILIPHKAIRARVQELARQISSDYAGKEPVLIGILNGVVFFFADLVMAMSIPCKIDFIRAASYGSGMNSSGNIKLVKDIEIPVGGKDVLVVEDIVDTGLTLNHIVRALEARGPLSVKVCALIDKKERREKKVTIDYCGFEVEEGFLVGYGLDYDEQYRYLPDICVLK